MIFRRKWRQTTVSEQIRRAPFAERKLGTDLSSEVNMGTKLISTFFVARRTFD
jgi:hypothetical protein